MHCFTLLIQIIQDTRSVFVYAEKCGQTVRVQLGEHKYLSAEIDFLIQHKILVSENGINVISYVSVVTFCSPTGHVSKGLTIGLATPFMLCPKVISF